MNQAVSGTDASILAAHPRFGEAMRTFAAGMIALHRRNRVMSWFLKDRPLAVIGHAVIYLDTRRHDGDPQSGLTPGRFRAFCRDNDLCSPGRAGAILAFLRFSGHVEAIPHPGDRRITRLRPSAKLLDMARARLAQQFAALALLRPDLAPAADALGQPEFETELYRRLGQWFIAGNRLLDPAPALRLFAERDCGMLILFALMLAGADDDLPVPTRPVPISIAGLARQFQVSRPHVLRLIRDAEAAGSLTRGGPQGETVCFSPALAQDLRALHAGVFALFAHSAAHALQAQSKTDAPTIASTEAHSPAYL